MTSAAAADTADQHVFGGFDSHADTLHVAVISDNGGHLADAEFTTTAAGYAAAMAFMTAHGQVIAIGVEGTSSYGAGFTSAARSHGHLVVEVNRPDRAERRRIGKSDPIDAYAAARAACRDGPPAPRRTPPSPAYAPCTTPPAPPSKHAPPP
ncbi:transposase [Streptomyces sp. NPDC048241]|uniref:IS110 family transposase n=1 Tax=Streptomyces sp. NPDC048241 TaxID=3365521 RepID=UPI00371D9854